MFDLVVVYSVIFKRSAVNRFEKCQKCAQRITMLTLLNLGYKAEFGAESV